MLRKLFPVQFYTKSYSQEGEDLILNRYFEDKNSGFYVDIGAHHPQRFSNTFFFYKKGWTGLNIEATPHLISKFNKLRKRDTNVLAAVSSAHSDGLFYEFNEPALNTFDPELAKQREALGYKVIKKSNLPKRPLAEILKEHVKPNQKIDFMSIDIEGEDLNALKSNDWSLFQPEIILVEVLSRKGNYAFETNSETETYLKTKSYSFFAKAMNTYFFKRDTSC